MHNELFGIGMLRVLFCICFLFCSSSLYAQQRDDQRIAVLKLNNDAKIPEQEVNYLSNLIRQITSSTLAHKFLVMDKENIKVLLPPGKTIADCQGQCAVDTGRRLGAAFIITGDVMNVDTQLRVIIKLHNTSDSGLISSEIVSGKKITEMESDIQQACTRLLRHLIRDDYESKTGQLSRRSIGKSSRFMRAIRKKVITTFTSIPKGAGVIVDGVQECAEDKDVCKIVLTEGSHQVSMTKAHYFVKEKTVNINESNNNIEWSLDANFATLKVYTTPRSLIYTINGEETFGMREKHIKPNEVYSIISSDPCYNKTGEEIIADALGSVVKVHLQPQPLQAVIDVNAYNSQDLPIKAEVHVDNKLIGKTPGEFLISSCAKSLVVKHKEYKDQSINLSLNDGDVESFNIKLKVLPPKITPREEAEALKQRQWAEAKRRRKELAEAKIKRQIEERRRAEEYERKRLYEQKLARQKREAEQRALIAQRYAHMKKQQEKKERAETGNMIIQGIVYVGLVVLVVMGIIPL